MEENGNGIAEWYAELVRGGSAMHGFARDVLLKALPVNIIGIDVLDVGCGVGIVTRGPASTRIAAVPRDRCNAPVNTEGAT